MPDLLVRLQAALAGRYQLERELGGGGMSRVFAAEEIALGRKVVIKVLPPELAASLSTDRFHREIQLAASLQHPHIVPLLSAGDADGLLYFSMPLVEGESLRARLSREGELPVAEAIRILHDVADALRYAHRHGVMHRDIKPDNVLLTDGHALVTDFGVAKAVSSAAEESSLTGTGLALGTPAYMAPEQAVADPHTDHRADIYALGVLGYEMLAGQPPFSGRSVQALIAAHLSQTPPPLSLARASVPAALSAAIMRCLEKRPADRWQSADELIQTLEHPRTSGTVEAIPELPVGHRTSLLSHLRRWPVMLLATCGVIGLLLLTWLTWQQSQRSRSLDADLLAVAPFDAPDPRLALWHEGLVDLLSRNLDGAGPLRTVPPTTVIRRWSGRADRPSAGGLGRRTGASMVVYGSLIAAGADSVRLTATALDVANGRPIAEIELRDAANRMDRLTDSLTVRLLRQLGRSRGFEVLRTGSLGSTSLPALKAFLQGEQWFRRAAWDSALASYGRAVAIDSQFPLALRRESQVLGWQRSALDTETQELGLKAGALNHGLSRRDSLFVTADSLQVYLYSLVPRADWSALRRLHDIAGELTRLYPDDFESWYLMGEVRIHFGQALGTTPAQALEAFDRAIANDSSFAPSYIHQLELALFLGDPALADRYARSYLRLDPTDVSAGGVKLTHRILEARRNGARQLDTLLRNAAPSALTDAWYALRRWGDSAETATAVARALVAAPTGDAPWLTRDQRERRLGLSLLYRGHLRQALPHLEHNPAVVPAELVEAALMGAPWDSATVIFRGWAETGGPLAPSVTLPWWAARRDTAMIRQVERRGESVARAATNPVDHNIGLYTAAAAQAYLALVRRDTAGALRRFEAVADSLCPYCYQPKLTRAQLLSAMKQDQEAEQLLDGWLVYPIWPAEVLWTLERGRVAERLGKREKAAKAYQYVADVWRHADPELQPYVAEARQALARLTAEK